VAVGSVVVPAPHPEPESRLKSVTRDASFLRSDLRCRRYVSVSNVTLRYLGSEQKDRVSLFIVEIDFQLMFSFLVVELEDC